MLFNAILIIALAVLAALVYRLVRENARLRRTIRHAIATLQEPASEDQSTHAFSQD